MQIVGLDGIREAYQGGRGTFRTRATAKVEQLSPRKSGIVVTELPYGIGPEKVIARIKAVLRRTRGDGVEPTPRLKFADLEARYGDAYRTYRAGTWF